MTNQEKRTKSGQLIVEIIQAKPAVTVKEIEQKTKLPHEEVVSTFRGLEDKGMGRFIVGRRGQPSRFVRFADQREESPAFPIDVAIKNVSDDGRIELHFIAEPGYLGGLLDRIKSAGLAQMALDFSDGKPRVIVMVPSGEHLGNVIKALRNGNKSLS